MSMRKCRLEFTIQIQRFSLIWAFLRRVPFHHDDFSRKAMFLAKVSQGGNTHFGALKKISAVVVIPTNKDNAKIDVVHGSFISTYIAKFTDLA